MRKTIEHRGKTLEHGDFRVRETEYVCARRCIEPAASGARPRVVTQRQAEVNALILPRRTIGYDVMTFVGYQRYVEHRQREDIRNQLRAQYGITISTGEVSELERSFLIYLDALHHARAPELRRALAADGGWPLHIDATCENGQGTLLVAYAGWRRWVLGAWKIPTERADAILPRLRALEQRFGAPCAVMRDLGKAVIESARELVGQRPIPILGCHLHFIKDIGKDLLRPSHDELRDLFRRLKVMRDLRALVRQLGRGLGADIERARADVVTWLPNHEDGLLLPEGNAGLAVVRALAQWVLDYTADGTDAGFPFDRPWLDFYRRCLRACRAAESLLWKPWDDQPVHQALERLHSIVEPVRSELPFERPARILESRARLFDELRDTLRLEPKPPTSEGVTQQTLLQSTPPAKCEELRDLQKAVADFQAALHERRPTRGPAKDLRAAIDVILQHLDVHGPSLWGHAVALPAEAGGGHRLVERTNSLLENFFHEMKHGERQRSGRKVLTQDFEHLPAAAAIARNLTRPDYVEILCGTLENLPRAFAAMDVGDRTRSLPVRFRTAPIAEDEIDLVSASMPKADRKLVRTQAMRERVFTEASTRAARRPPIHRRKGRSAGS